MKSLTENNFNLPYSVKDV